MKNNNGAVIRRLTAKSLKANKKRNLFIITAIALTTLLIASVFSIGMSLLESVKINQIRLAGTVAQAAVGHPTASQVKKLKALDYVKVVGTNNNVGFVKNTPELGKISLALHYFDKTEWEELHSPAYVDIEGNYPEKENEIMVSLAILKRLGIDTPFIGMEIPITYYTDKNNKDALISESFRLSGWFRSYAFVQSMNTAEVMLVSRELSQKYGKTVEKDGSATIIFDKGSRVSQYCRALVSDLDLTENQPVVTVESYNTNIEQTVNTFIALCAIVVFLIFTGYLLIYNVLTMSVSRDVRFYGLLKTLGTTPKQIKRIVTGQTLRLCMLGIPIGVVGSLLISFFFVPIFIAKLAAVSTEAVISFSPLIYVGAVCFALLTALLSAMKPAKKAAGISPIEALKYTRVEVMKQNNHSPAHFKPYKMAFRNILRDKKSAGVVLLSLFLGVTTFLTITTLVFSMKVDSYVESMFEGDFLLKNNAWPKQKFDQDFLEKVKALPGFEDLSVMTWGRMELDYSPSLFRNYITDLSARESIEDLTEEEIDENFRGFMIGIDGKALMKLNKTLDKPINVDAFNRGEFALIATDDPSLFTAVHELSVTPLYGMEASNKEKHAREKIIIPVGGFVPLFFKNTISGLAPTIFVSNTFVSKLYMEPFIAEVNFNVSNGYDKQALDALKKVMAADYEISYLSKAESMDELKNAKMVLYVLGGGAAFVIALIGMLNFVNVISVSVVVRKRELATLEAVGMSRKQVRRMLVSEGLEYAVIILFLFLTAGSTIAFGIFKLFQQQATYTIFTYPFIPVLITCLVVLAICIITPDNAYRSIYKATIVERLKESE